MTNVRVWICRQVRGLTDHPAEPVLSRHYSDDDGSRAASSNTNSASESVHGRNDGNPADNEPCTSVEAGSVEPRKTSGRRSGNRRTER